MCAIKENVDTKYIDIGDIFDKFGKFQVWQFTLLCLPACFVMMININFVFAAGDLNYRCRIPECENSTTNYNVSWYPTDVDRCSKPVLKHDHVPGTACSNYSFSGLVEECTEFVYESNDTIVGDLNLGCRPWLINSVGTVHSAGMLVSMVIGGWMSDRFGRKPILIICVVGSVIGQLKTLSTSYYMYIIVEFLEAAISGGCYSCAMIIMLEICGTSNRVLSGVVFAYAIYCGELLFACIAMLVPYWKNLIHIITAPPILFISYYFLVIESPRWQILNGKIEAAKKTLLDVAKINKININQQELADLDENKLKDKFNIETFEKQESLTAAFTSKTIMKRLFVISVCRFTSSFVYYGMMVNSVYLPGNKYTNFLLATLMSFPGELLSLYLMNKIGRKVPLIVGYLISGLLTVVSGYVPDEYKWLKVTVFLIGKGLMSACFTGAITYTMELFPTSVRGSMLGLGSVAERIGGLLAPLTPILNPISEALPLILFASSAFLSGALLTLTPETKGVPLMDTLQQVEENVRQETEKAKNQNIT